MANCCREHFLIYWKSFIVVAIPLLCLPLPLSGYKEAMTGYVMIIMAFYWMTEALPLPITSLIPVIAFPLLGISNAGAVCMNYFTETVMMFIGGLIVGLAVEYCNLHQRIALRVILFVGTDPKWLMLGFMTVSMFLSMWISNTGATAMIVPIVEALVVELCQEDETMDENDILLTRKPTDDEEKGQSKSHVSERERHMKLTLLMAVAYSANIGGTGTLIGSTPQLALKGIVEDLYGSNSGLTFANWMAINVPAMILSTLAAWIWLQALFLGLKRKQKTENQNRSRQVKEMIGRKYKELGSITFHEIVVLILFTILIFLWLFRDPKFIPGWENLFPKKVGDAVPAIAVIVLLFMLPARPNFWCFRNSEVNKVSPAMLNWSFLQDKLPWGLILLLGSGFALSDASKKSGLNDWLGQQFSGLESLPRFGILVIVCLFTSAMTEVVSNTATASIVLPILAQIAEAINVNPLYLMIPAAVTCCYAFMLPVGTPPNAIVYSAAKMKPLDMIKAGILMKLICIAILCIFMEVIGTALYPSQLSVNETALLEMNGTLTSVLPLESNVTLSP